MPWFHETYHDTSAIGIHIGELVHSEQSPYQKIEVFETRGHGRLLLLDGMVMLTELDEFVYHELISHVPLCIHPDPKRVLVVGGGDGGTVREVLKHRGVEQVVLCEIDERVTRVCQEFIPAVAGQLGDPRVELVFADAVQYVRDHRDAFDAILVDSSEPIGPAAGLFAGAFFADLRRALRPGGVIAAQTESPFYAADTVRSVFAEIRGVFSRVHAYYGCIPTYPSGCWTFALASDTRGPEGLDPARAAAIAGRYFDADLGRGAFALPVFIRRLVEPAAADR
jgi:spermidine synthase